MKAFPLFLILPVLIAGCASHGTSHGTWSKSDRGAWANLDGLIGNHERSYYVKQWGEPVILKDTPPWEQGDSPPWEASGDRFNDWSRKTNVTTDGEELLWLWKSDGTGPSNQPGQGWEMFLTFNEQGRLRNWRVGTYRTTLTIVDVIVASRRVRQSMPTLISELGLSAQQHEIGDDLRFWMLKERIVVPGDIGGGDRQFELLKLQGLALEVSNAAIEADVSAYYLYGRPATETEIVRQIEVRAAEAHARAEAQRRLAYSNENNVQQQRRGMSSGFIGGGFLGPYTPNAYGPGMNSDATGRPFIWKPDFGGPALGGITPNAYGPGVGMDGTGRPVRPACPPGWAGPC